MINFNFCLVPEIQPGLHISEEVLELAEPDAGHGHELPHHREVAVARRHRLAPVELDLQKNGLKAYFLVLLLKGRKWL